MVLKSSELLLLVVGYNWRAGGISTLCRILGTFIILFRFPSFFCMWPTNELQIKFTLLWHFVCWFMDHLWEIMYAKTTQFCKRWPWLKDLLLNEKQKKLSVEKKKPLLNLETLVFFCMHYFSKRCKTRHIKWQNNVLQFISRWHAKN